MRWTLWKAPKGYEDALAPALVSGASACGDTVEIVPTDDYDAPRGDGGIIFGVVKREILWDHVERGVPLIYLDKGFVRRRAMWRGLNMPVWWRICVNGIHPSDRSLSVAAPTDRLAASELLPLQELTPGGDAILIAGSSAKFHTTMGLPDPTAWVAELIGEVRRYTDAPIIYRPKPSWKYAEPVDGAEFDHGAKSTIEQALARSRVMITYGSIASVDAIRLGTPCIVLGNAPAHPVSGFVVDQLRDPPWFSQADRLRWAANLSYHQFTPAEIADGTAWRIVKERAHVLGSL